jgi:hypothetical protein
VLNGQQNQYFLQYKENQNVTCPIQLNVAYSISWSEQKRKYNYSKMAANFRDKRTSITTMRAKNQAFDIFLTLVDSSFPSRSRGPHTLLGPSPLSPKVETDSRANQSLFRRSKANPQNQSQNQKPPEQLQSEQAAPQMCPHWPLDCETVACEWPTACSPWPPGS